MIGGRLSMHGGIAVGAAAERALADCAADLCFLGACGLHPSFGLGADDGDEASMKRSMAEAAARVAVVASRSKLHRVARHRALGPAAFEDLITDANREATEPYVVAGVTVHHV
jgi:DeoR/GlpR family transcriptional regulator of sugar metabolism